jgi:hypothetical protein
MTKRKRKRKRKNRTYLIVEEPSKETKVPLKK